MVPYLAKSVEPNADFTAWKITLRDGIKFHDGTPLDSADAVKRNFEAYREDGTAHRRRVYKHDHHVTVVGPLTSPSPRRFRGPRSPGTSTSTAASSSWRPPSSTTPTATSNLIGTGRSSSTTGR